MCVYIKKKKALNTRREDKVGRQIPAGSLRTLQGTTISRVGRRYHVVRPPKENRDTFTRRLQADKRRASRSEIIITRNNNDKRERFICTKV